jgi:predicted transcriptional regulator
MKRYSEYTVTQAGRVAELVAAGYSNADIAEQLGVSRPRISQIRHMLPAIRDQLTQPEPTKRLQEKRDRLYALRHQALLLAASIRRDLRELDEELESANTDRVLGFRR